MPILRSAFQPEKQTLSNHPVIQNPSVDALTDGRLSTQARSQNMAKFCTRVSIRSETSDIVELSDSSSESPVRDQTSDYFFFGEDQELVEVLHSHGCYESEDGLFKRKAIVMELETLVRQWIRSVGLGKGLSWKMVEEAEGRLLTYGSYRLGAVSQDGDLDILCVVPEHVDRNDFFSSLYSLLEKRGEDIAELRRLPEAFVPVIKMRFKGIEVDLTFASLHCRKIPYEDRFLQYEPTSLLDPRCQHSLNGYRATLEILDLVPDIPAFLVALRAVKLWAKKNGIYGNILGFPGGFSWALLVVRTCQENQGASPSELVHRFFQSWSSWRWPQPVYIKPSHPQPYPAWNPDLSPVDASHCMPIVTPTTPQINSTNLVTASTLQVIRARLLRSLRVCENIRAGREAWNALFQAPGFFQEYKDFLLVAGTCEFGHATWFGLIESQLRHLKDHLEKECGVNAAQIWPIAFKRDDGVSVTRMWFLGVEMQPGHDVGSIQQSIKLFQDLLFAKANRSNFNKTMTLAVHPVTDRDLKDYISEEEMELPERKKLSYAAVTLGLKEDESAPVPITTVQDLPTFQSAENLNAPQSLIADRPKVIFPTTDDPEVTKTVRNETPVLKFQNMSLSPKFPAATTVPVGLESGDAISNLGGLFQAPPIPLLAEPLGSYQATPTPPPTDPAGLYQAPSTPRRIQLANANYQQPGANANYQQPSANANYQQPSADANYQQPGANANYQQPSADANYQQPGADANYLQPGADANYQQPSANANYQQPGANANYQQPSTNANYQQPGANANYQQPGANANYQQPSANANYQQPGANANYQQPSANANYQQPSANANYQQPGINQFIGRPTAFTFNQKVKEDKIQTGARDTNQNLDKESNRHGGQGYYQNRPTSSTELSSTSRKSFSRPHNSSNNNFSRGYFKNAPRGYIKSRTFPSKTHNVNHKPPNGNIETVKESLKNCSPPLKQLSDPTSLDEARLRSTAVATKSTTISSISIRSVNINEGSDRVLSAPLRTLLPVIPQPNFRVPPPQLQSIPFVNSSVVEKRSSHPGRPVGDGNSTQDTTYLPSKDIDSKRSFSNSDAECTYLKGGVRDFEGKERLRSLSNSSDNSSPSNVPNVRVTHHQNGPISPMWGVDPLPLVPDMTVPPPSLSVDNCRTHVASPSRTLLASPSIENSRTSHPITNSNPPPSFATANTNRQRDNPTIVSQGEIRDAPVPRPVNIPKKNNIR